jgi:cytidylate kinase
MPVIAMTREIGSLGTEVAARVAKRLGLEIVRSEVAANNVARRLGVAESAVSRYLDGSASLLERWQIDRRKLFHYASEEILSLAQRGNVLIKGWGAATMLRDLPQVINVRVCAPMEFRVRVMMERQGRDDAPTVQEEIERFDAGRARTLRAYFNVEQEDARLYHIVFNTERLSVDACVAAVCKLAPAVPRHLRVTLCARQQASGGQDQLGTGRSYQRRHGALGLVRLDCQRQDHSYRHDQQRELAEACRGDRARQRWHAANRQPHPQHSDPRQRVLTARSLVDFSGEDRKLPPSAELLPPS